MLLQAAETWEGHVLVWGMIAESAEGKNLSDTWLTIIVVHPLRFIRAHEVALRITDMPPVRLLPARRPRSTPKSS